MLLSMSKKVDVETLIEPSSAWGAANESIGWRKRDPNSSSRTKGYAILAATSYSKDTPIPKAATLDLMPVMIVGLAYC